MKNLTKIYLLIAAFGFTSQVYAGAGHSHDNDGGHSHSSGPISESKAKVKATRTMKNLASRGVIKKSWTSSKLVKAEKIIFSKEPEWVVSFVNENMKDKTKQTLYIFYSLDGHYIAANYTGK
ncbi:MAG: hypothetical protein KAT06_06915 [Gammaproteobacteria bacterium]|nr:hypothetical protein [Gammaproteobacteria bacterium]